MCVNGDIHDISNKSCAYSPLSSFSDAIKRVNDDLMCDVTSSCNEGRTSSSF